MKKFLLLLLSILMISATTMFFVGCSGNGGDGGNGNTITITYYDGKSEAGQTVSIIKESTSNTLSLTRKGYTFMGLYDSQTGGLEIFDKDGNQVVPLASSTTLYARWEKVTYTKHFFVQNFGSISEDEEVLVQDGDAIATLPVPEVDEGYEFIGWMTAEEDGELISDAEVVKDEFVQVSEETASIWFNNSTFYAKIEIEKHTVTFYYHDDDYTEEQVEIEDGQPLETAPELQSDDYKKREFVGWSMSETEYIPFESHVDCISVEKDLEIHAIWRYWRDVTFVISEDDERVERIYSDQSFEIPDYEVPGYVNTGWFTTPRFDTKPVTEVGYTSSYSKFYGRYEYATYTLKFNLNGGNYYGSGSIADRQYQFDDEFQLPIVEKENYTFIGWYEEGTPSTSPFRSITKGTYGNKTLIAKYKGDSKTVIYNIDQGSIANDEKVVEYGAEYTLDIPQLEGYGFVGWFLDEDLQVQLTNKYGEGINKKAWDILAEETQVYAKYDKKYYVRVTHSITDAGTCFVEDYYVEGERVEIFVETKPQYVCKGIKVNGTLVSDDTLHVFTMTNSDVFVTIEYEPKQFIISLDKGEGVYLSYTSVQVSYGQEYSLPTPVKEGHRFVGWEYSTDEEIQQITNEKGESLQAFLFTANITVLPYFVKDDSITDKLIDSAEDFLAIKDDPTASYQLVANINMNYKAWTMFDFAGRINGNGFTVSNLAISADSGNVALFNTLSGSITGLNFTNVLVTSTSYDENSHVAGICVVLTGTLSGITFNGSIKAEDSVIGGLVAKLNGGTISNCTNLAKVEGVASSGNKGTGGIVGISQGGTIENCTNSGKIIGKFCTGGILGRTIGGNTSITNVTNTGVITAAGNYTGGICGYFARTGEFTLKQWENSANVSGNSYVGGVCGAYENVYQSGDNATRKADVNQMLNSGKVVATGNYVGGLFGFISADAKFTDGGYSSDKDGLQKIICRNFTNTGAVEGVKNVGGTVGYFSSDDSSSEFIDFVNSATITATGVVGGIIAESHNLIISSALNTGTKFIVESAYIDGSNKYAYVGGFVGLAYNTNISNANNNSNINYTSSESVGSYIGGIAAYSTGTFENCSNSGNIVAPKSSYVGGICGLSDKDYGYTSQKLTNTGNITGINHVGGIFGALINEYYSPDNGSRTLNFNIISNTGEITATGNYIGGIIGYARIDALFKDGGYSADHDGLQNMMARKLSNNADITGVLYVGGLFGYFSSDDARSEFIEPKSKANINAMAYVGGLVGESNNLKITNPSNKDTTITSTEAYISGSNNLAYIGGYVGRAVSTNIDGALNQMEIVYVGSTCTGAYIGGITGWSSGTFTNCINNADIIAPKSNYVGGICGSSNKAYDYTCSSLGNNGTVKGVNYVGGVFGSFVNDYVSYDNASRTTKLDKVSNFGEVIATGNYAGGIAGYVRLIAQFRDGGYSADNDGLQGLLGTKLENNANVTGILYVGGIFGYFYSDDGSSELIEPISSAEVTATAYLGGLIGESNNLKITNASNERSKIIANSVYINGTNQYAYLGGYVGLANSTHFTGTTNTVEISYTGNACTGNYVGGIAGYMTGTLSNCTNNAKVLAPSSTYVGGIAGQLKTTHAYTISGVTNNGEVQGKNYVAGLFGEIYNVYSSSDNATRESKLTNLTNTGKVVASGNYVGGIAGNVNGNAQFRDGGYSADHDGLQTYLMQNINNAGNIQGGDMVGGIFGKFYTDGTSQVITFTQTGQVTGTGTFGEIIASYSNVKLPEVTQE